MKIKKVKVKQGFTIVELVIVIGVIGVLTAVLIPTFINLNKKAEMASMQSFIKNVNTQLAMREAEGKKLETPNDAMVIAEDMGFDVEKISPFDGNDIVYDGVAKRFAMMKGEEVTYSEGGVKGAGTDIWKIADSAEKAAAINTAGYSIYAKETWNIGNLAEIKVGFDAGRNMSAESVSYVNPTASQNVIIRTNGGAVTINGKQDNVIHYGDAESVNIIDVASASYHEKGAVKFLEAAAGHIVVEKEAEVTAFHFTATGEGENAKFENAEGKKISVDISGVSQDKMPDFSRDPVKIETNGTYVAEVNTGKKEYIWLFGQGIKEQMVVAPTNEAIAEGGTLKSTLSIGAQQGSVAEQIANPAKRNDQGQLVDTNDQVIDLTQIDMTKATALDEKAVVEEVASKEDVQTGATLFAGGSGSQYDPYIISDFESFQNISTLYNEGYHYYKVKDGVASIDCSGWTPVNLNGSFEGNGVKLQNIDARLFMNIGAMGTNGDAASWSTTPVTLANYDAYFKLEGDMDAAGGMAKQILGNNVTTLKNIGIYGQIVSGSNSGAFFSYSTGNPYDANQNVTQRVNIEDCGIYANLISTSSSVAVVTGYPNYCNPNIVVSINNPDEIWQGTAANPSGKIKFVTMSSWSIPEGGTENRTIDCTKLNTVALTKESDGSYTVAKSTNAVTAKAYISAQLTETDAEGHKTAVAGITMAVQTLGEYSLDTASTKVLDAFNSFEFHNKQAASSAAVVNNKLIVNIDGNNNYTFGSIKLVVVENDSNGNILSYQVKEIVSKTETGNWTIK